MRVTLMAMLAALAAMACGGGDDRVCDPGRSVACTCVSGLTGSQNCLQDGSGYDECVCCTPDCSGRECGPDPTCGVNCGDCQAPQVCSEAGQCGDPPCTSHQECIIQHGSSWFCNPLTFECECNPTTACVGMCDGDDGCGGTCPNTCGAGLVCDPGSHVCVVGCCSNQQVHVRGLVVDMTTRQGVALGIGALAPMGFITGTNLEPLVTTSSLADGIFETDCFDATNVALGLVVLADDVGFDGAGGTYFPTCTGVIGWSDAAEKVCVEDADVFAVPNTIVTALGALPGFSSADGFVMGFVLDASSLAVEGAVVKKADGTDFAAIYYPSATFTDFTGTATSATGLFLIPGPQNLTTAKPEKAGMTWGESQVAAVPGYCYFVTMQAE